VVDAQLAGATEDGDLDFDGRHLMLGVPVSGQSVDGTGYLLRRRGRRLVLEAVVEGGSRPQLLDGPLAFGSAVAIDARHYLVGAPGIASAFVYRAR
jgi:hypothetical protein